MEAKQPPKSQCAACGAPVMERNRYYTGKFMTARDFQGEQEYLRSRHQLHNRLVHGWGIICGLEVKPHKRQECHAKTVVVKAGVALDCCGREVVLGEDTVFDVPRTKRAEPHQAPPEPAQDYKAAPEKGAPEHREHLLLCLYYAEHEIELTPAIYSEGTSEGESEQANRVRECASLRLVRLDEVSENCWQRGGHPAKCRDDCDDQIPGPAGACLEPDCPCGGCVPLALISYDPYRDDDPVAIDDSGRRRLPVHADFLTHIVGLNWHHGGQMTLSHLRNHLKGRLEIRFDRKIRAATENRSLGVSEFTFVVQFGGVQEDVRFLPYPYKEPPTLEDDCVAVFRIDPKYLDEASRDDLKDKVVYISLKCDFILDCRGMPVDGAHLKGTLPTRSGRMGGVFESWFYVAEDEDDNYRRLRPPEDKKARYEDKK
jgi:hypothetical protein